MKHKIIKVEEKTHTALKVGASNRGISMKEHLSQIANDLVEGCVFDVGRHNIDMLKAVKADICEELKRRGYEHE